MGRDYKRKLGTRTQKDLRLTVNCYLNVIDRKVKQLLKNVLGKDWVKSFLTIYPKMKERFAAHIKRSRVKLFEKTLRAYIENLMEIMKDVPKML